MAEASIPSQKKSLSRPQRAMRLIASSLDPRAWLHLFKIINYSNYSHVTPMRQISKGEGCKISPDVNFSNPENITLGKRVSLGSRCFVWGGAGQGRIRIADDVLFGPEVLVTAANYRFNDGSPVTEQLMDEADVSIGRDAWLGARVIVLPGVCIGEGAVVAAGAVVRSDIPAYAIAAGVPAKIVGQRSVPGFQNADSP